MQYILNEDELRALKAQSDVAAQAKAIAQDYRRRLGEAIVKQVQPFFRHCMADDREVARFLTGLRDAIHAVSVIPGENNS